MPDLKRLPSLTAASAVLGAALLLTSSPAAADIDVKVRLILDGKDVTPAHANDLVRFISRSTASEGKGLTEVGCAVSQTCPLPPGAYSVDLDAQSVVVETRPKLFAGGHDEGLAVVTLSLTAAASVTVTGLPKGGMLQALDERLAVLHSRLVYGPTARVRVPARPVILCAYHADRRPLGCWPVSAKPGETVALAGLPRLREGRGQLLVDFVYPTRNAAHDLAVSLRCGGALVPPDAVVSSHPDRLLAVWYDVPAGPAALEAASPGWVVNAPLAVTVPDRTLSARRSIPLVRRATPN